MILELDVLLQVQIFGTAQGLESGARFFQATLGNAAGLVLIEVLLALLALLEELTEEVDAKFEHILSIILILESAQLLHAFQRF